jgi:hypothetical protein
VSRTVFSNGMECILVSSVVLKVMHVYMYRLELLSVTSFAMKNYFRVQIEKWYCEYFLCFFFFIAVFGVHKSD